MFPPVCEPGTVAGARDRARRGGRPGLRPGTPVVVGGADTQLGLLGIGVGDPDRVTIVGGSFWQTTVVTDHPLIDPEARLRTLCHAVPGRWMMEGIGFYCGITMRWYRDAFCELEKLQARERGVDPYVVMEEAAAAIPPGANGVLGIFSNVMDAKRWVHASPSLLQFNVDDPARSNRVAAIRAIEESGGVRRPRPPADHRGPDRAARAPRSCSPAAARRGRCGRRSSPTCWACRCAIPVVKESTALGAAICAGVGAGLFADAAAQARRVVRIERTVEPDPAAHEAYVRLYDRWLAVYARQLELSEAGLLRPLWCAAGT